MCLKLCLAFLMLLIGLVQGKIVFLPDDKIEDCSKPGEKAGYYDLSKVEIVIETDTEIFINGTVLFLEEVTGPWKTHVYTEQYVRSKWVPAVVEKKVPDLCSSLHKPNEAWYNHLKDQTGCPIPKGVSKKKKFNFENFAHLF